VDAIVALTQTPLESNERLLLDNPRIDAVLSEERSEIRSAARFVGGRPIATPGGNLASLIRLELTVDEGGRVTSAVRAIPLDPTVGRDPELKAMTARYMARLEDSLAVDVARTETGLESGMYGDARARWTESNAGNLIADAFRAHYGADVGLIQGGGIRASVPAGPVTRREVLSLLPFHNRVLLIRTSGAVIRKALEHGVSAVEEQSGRFLQVSGLRYRYDPAEPAGSRVQSVELGGDPLPDDTTLTVALPGYLAAGGDGFGMFEEAEVLTGPGEAPTDAEVLERYLSARATVRPQLEGRIEMIGHEPTPSQ
jgi:5'-nucleotidase